MQGRLDLPKLLTRRSTVVELKRERVFKGESESEAKGISVDSH